MLEMSWLHEKFPVWNTNKYRTREEDLLKQDKYVDFKCERIEDWSKKFDLKLRRTLTVFLHPAVLKNRGQSLPCHFTIKN